MAEFLTANQAREQMLERMGNLGARILDPKVYLLDASQRGRVVQDGQALYYDDNHLSVLGAQQLRPMFLPLFAQPNPTPSTTRANNSLGAGGP